MIIKGKEKEKSVYWNNNFSYLLMHLFAVIARLRRGTSQCDVLLKHSTSHLQVDPFVLSLS